MTDAPTSQLPTPEAPAPNGDVSVEEARGVGMGGGSDDLTSEFLVEEVSIDGMCGVY